VAQVVIADSKQVVCTGFTELAVQRQVLVPYNRLKMQQEIVYHD